MRKTMREPVSETIRKSARTSVRRKCDMKLSSLVHVVVDISGNRDRFFVWIFLTPTSLPTGIWKFSRVPLSWLSGSMVLPKEFIVITSRTIHAVRRPRLPLSEDIKGVFDEHVVEFELYESTVNRA
jgi:hypothetical protein